MASASYSPQKTLFIPLRLLHVEAPRLALPATDAHREAAPTVAGAWDRLRVSPSSAPGSLRPPWGKARNEQPCDVVSDRTKAYKN